MKLDDLFNKYGSDKGSNHHNYSPHYEKILEPLKSHPINMLILGIGGYQYEDRGGGDIKAFCEYLPYSLIDAVDIYPKVFLNKKDRVYTHVGDQNDEELFKRLRDMVGGWDIIIDDASHINSKTIKSFEILFPMLKNGGYYIIEDVHTSYWWEIASDGTDFEGCVNGKGNSVIEYFKKQIDISLNEKEYFPEYTKTIKASFTDIIPLQSSPYTNKDIESIQFFNKMIVVKKK